MGTHLKFHCVLFEEEFIATVQTNQTNLLFIHICL